MAVYLLKISSNILYGFVFFGLMLSCNQTQKFNSNKLKQKYWLMAPYPDVKFGVTQRTAIEMDQMNLGAVSGFIDVEFYNENQGAIVVRDSVEIFLTFTEKPIKGKIEFEYLIKNDSILLLKFNNNKAFQEVGYIKSDRSYKNIRVSLNNGLKLKLLDGSIFGN